MRRYVLTLLAAATLVAPVLTGTASAAPYPSGFACGLEPGHGPESGTYGVDATLVLTDDTVLAPLHAGSVTCLVDDGTGVQEVTGPVATGVAIVRGTVTVGGGSDVYLCTRVDITGGPTLYFDVAAGTWAADDTGCWTPVV